MWFFLGGGESGHIKLFRVGGMVIFSCDSSSIRDNVRRSVGQLVGWLVGPSRPRCAQQVITLYVTVLQYQRVTVLKDYSVPVLKGYSFKGIQC